jgi:hypothetical protein
MLAVVAGCSPATSLNRNTAINTINGPATEANLAVAGLVSLPAGEWSDWRLPDNLIKEGQTTFSRVVTGQGLISPQALELGTGAGDRTEYFLEMDSSEPELSYRFQFRSTQGTGRLNLTAVGNDGQTVGQVGFVFTGVIPEKNERTVWLDRRHANNYQGDWVQEQIRPAELFAFHIPAFSTESVVRYRIGIEAGNGQHVLITDLKSASSQVEGTKVVWRSVPSRLNQGETVTLKTEVSNVTDRGLENLSLTLVEPYGYGLVAQGPLEQKIARLAAGETVSLEWTVKAQRASTVNTGKPWELRLLVNKSMAPAMARIDVIDPTPGQVFYVMTEDLEPIDAAGYPTAWGNQNGWLDAEEFRVQLIDKAQALNRIAEKHGAFWTHYIAMPVMEAAEWAAAQSSQPDWRTTLEQVRASIRAESKRGHEYALHLHSDYDPQVPGNVLSYNPATDGFWANHLRHGWAHSFPVEGDPGQRATRTGILFHYLRQLTKLTADFPTGEVLTARTGSFDFGNGPESEAMSMRAYKAAGLWGNSDADGNAGGITSGEFLKAVYLTPPDDINAPATDLKKLGLVQFRPTPRQLIMYDIDSAAVMNEKVRQGMNLFVEGGRVRPGVMGITGFSHAMFIMGDGGWKSTTGNHYQALDEHLAFLKQEFGEKGLLRFGTATDLVRAYLDYYWPQPLVLLGPLQQAAPNGLEFSLDFIGRNIPVDRVHKHQLTLKVPLRYWDSGLRATLLKNGQPVQELHLKGNRHEISFLWDNRKDVYRLVIGQRVTTKPAPPTQKLFDGTAAPAGKAKPLPAQPANLLKNNLRPRPN